MNNLFSTKKRLTGLIWSLIFGFSYAYLFSIHILNFWDQSKLCKLILIISLSIIFTVLCYMLLVRNIFPRLSSIGKYKLYLFMVICLVFAAAFSAVLPIQSPLPPQWSNLKIIVPESASQTSDNNEVWLMNIVVDNNEIIPFDSLKQIGSWEEKHGYLIAKSGPASLEYRFLYHGNTEINIEFLSHERGGKVFVQMDNFEKHLDLFEIPGGISLCIVPITYITHFWLLCNAFSLFIAIFFFLFVFNSFWIFYIQGQNKKDNQKRPLVVFYIFATILRMSLPVYMIMSGQENSIRFQSSSYFEVGIISQYIKKLMLMIPAGDAYSSFLSTTVFYMMLQALIDSFGVFLVYAILNQTDSKKYSLWGAFLYSIWLPSIFYAHQVLTEAYVPIIMLLSAYFLVRSFHQEKWILSSVLFGLISAVSVFIRLDNALVVLIFLIFILFEYRKTKRIFFMKSIVILVSLIGFSFIIIKINTINGLFASHSMTFRESTSSQMPSLTLGLYNSLGEFPATYQGIRFFHDVNSYEHIINQTEYYQITGNTTYRVINGLLLGNSLSTYITEVIIDKPILYIDWIIRRLVHYLPSNPFFASILSFTVPSDVTYDNQYGYRFSQIFQGMKYFDYFLFLLFCSGLWHFRKNRAMVLSMLSIYFGILIGHVFTQCGEVYFRNDLEEVYLDPRYLLGMVSIWPIFIPAGVDGLYSFMHRLREIWIAVRE